MGYSKHETVKKQRKLVSKTQRNKRKVLVGVFKIFLVLIITVVIGVAGAGFGMMKGVLDNAPDINEISIVPKGFKTTIYDADGNPYKEISTIGSNREYVYYDDIPKMYIDAFVAIEDRRFWTHNGIDVKGILRAAVKGVASGNFDEGASTITQQLIKNHVFNVGMGETTFLDKLERKIQEQYLALELEKRYSKEQIVEYYVNTIYLGSGAHGIQAASETYFGKSMNELTLSEIAVIAGIPQNPSAYDPTIYPENNAERRKDVLDNMLKEGYITEAQYEEALADDVYARIESEYQMQLAEEDDNTYYEDALTQRLVDDFMELYDVSEAEAYNLIFTGGYSVYSVQDNDIQTICESVINDDAYVDNYRVGLEYELRIIDDGGEEHVYYIGDLLYYFRGITGNDKYNNIYDSEQAARAAADEFREAMLIQTNGTYKYDNIIITQQPQFSFVVMDQKTGYVKAMVGGKGEKTGALGWNRATDAPRQPGSTFKIVAAYLPLFDTGMGSLAKVYKDEPYYYTGGGMVHNWWGSKYRGYVNCREGIAQSMNVIAVKAITDVSPEVAFDYLMKLGFTNVIEQEIGSDGSVYSDITQSTALGGLTYGVTTYEMTAAYAAIANGGVYTEPVYYSKVVDHDGNVVIDNTIPTTHTAMKPTTAWQLIEGMKSVVNAGTGTPARMTTGITCAGKTGTTSSAYDLWFCGMTPYYTASIWMGFDSNVSMTGMYSSVHETMWRDIMDQIAVLEGQDPSLDFERPEGISYATVCKISGKSPAEKCPTISDYCAVDSYPSGKCTGHTMIKLCTESKQVATDECKNTIELVVEIDPVTKKEILVGSKGQDIDEYAYTKDECELHPKDKDKGKLTVSTSAGQGGTITATMKVAKGANAVVYITPYTGYVINDVLVNGQSVGATTSYTINNIQANCTVQATFKKVETAPPPQDTTAQTTTEAPTTEPPTTEAPATSTESPSGGEEVSPVDAGM